MRGKRLEMVLRFWRVLTISSLPTSRPIEESWKNILPAACGGVEKTEEGARLGDRLEAWGGGATEDCCLARFLLLASG